MRTHNNAAYNILSLVIVRLVTVHFGIVNKLHFIYDSIVHRITKKCEQIGQRRN